MWNQLKKFAQDMQLQEALDLFGYSVDDVVDFVDLSRRYMELYGKISDDNSNLEDEYYKKYVADPEYKDSDEYKNRYKQDPRYVDILKRRYDLTNAENLLKERAKQQRKDLEAKLKQSENRDMILGLPEDAKIDETISWWLAQKKFNLVAEYDRERWDTITYDVKILAPATDVTKDIKRLNRWGEEEDYRVDSSLVDKDGNIINNEYSPDSDFTQNREVSENLLWRGMSGNEFWKAIKDGYFASSGMLNFSDQQGQTCFASNMGSAFSYAGGFAPWYAEPTFEVPSYAIEMRRPDNAFVRSRNLDEVEVPGKIPVNYVNKVYEVKLASQRAGTMELVYNRQNKYVSGGSGCGPSNDFIVRELPESEWRNIKR